MHENHPPLTQRLINGAVCLVMFAGLLFLFGRSFTPAEINNAAAAPSAPDQTSGDPLRVEGLSMGSAGIRDRASAERAYAAYVVRQYIGVPQLALQQSWWWLKYQCQSVWETFAQTLTRTVRIAGRPWLAAKWLFPAADDTLPPGLAVKPPGLAVK